MPSDPKKLLFDVASARAAISDFCRSRSAEAYEADMTREIIAFRNRLIHGYDTVDSAIVWDVIQTRLPPLERRVRGLLERSE